MNPEDAYEAVIGLEVHAQLLTSSKAFCSCATAFGSEPNSNVCPVCLGLPGSLPVLNKQLVTSILKMGLAAHSSISGRSIFARKNYFYPDIPKGYQISQYEHPICTGGYVEIDQEDGSRKRIGLTRIHMEEDAGKSIHDAGDFTLLDLNRSGVPLIEIVSEPEIRSAREASLVLQKLRQIVTYLGICDGNMEEGSLRCDANISVRYKGGELGTRTEVKNINSFRNVERAVEFEIRRQAALLASGGTVDQVTLLWNANQNVAIAMRGKEGSDDYRYFPEPDLLPVVVTAGWIREVKETLPEDPSARRDKFMSEFGLPRYDAGVLTAEKETADFFEAALGAMKSGGRDRAKAVSNWVMTEVLRVVNEEKLPAGRFPVTPEHFAEMIDLIYDGTINGKIAKEVFDAMVRSGEAPSAVISKQGLVQISDPAIIDGIIDEILNNHPAQLSQYASGKEGVFGFLVGAIMKATKGRANPGLVNERLLKKIGRRG